MNQAVLWHDTIYDALGADISAAGGFKVVAGKLWPAESPTTAATKLRNAVNPEQAQKLCAEEVMQIKRLAKEAGSTATVQYEARELSYQITWVDPTDEIAQMERENNEMLRAILKRTERAEQLRTQQLRAVK